MPGAVFGNYKRGRRAGGRESRSGESRGGGFWREQAGRWSASRAAPTAPSNRPQLHSHPTPHRMLAVDENDELFSTLAHQVLGYGEAENLAEMILENLRTAGLQQAHKQDRITFTSLEPWPGRYFCAEGTYVEASATRRAGVFIGPEFGTVVRPDLVAAAREAADADFDVLVACAFSYDAHTTDFDKLGRIPVLKARMNADLHMAGDLKNTGKGNLFVIFGEPDIDILEDDGDTIRVRINGVDVFHPNTGEQSVSVASLTMRATR